jgi:hypothetical protein
MFPGTITPIAHGDQHAREADQGRGKNLRDCDYAMTAGAGCPDHHEGLAEGLAPPGVNP